MYDNIGGKIKRLARVSFVIEMLVAIIVGAILWIDTEEWWCALILFGGPFVAWVSSWLLYGYGEIIDKLCDIEEHTRKEYDKKKKADDSKTIKKTTTERESLEKAQKAANERDKIEKAEIAKMMEKLEYVDIICPQCGEKLSFEKSKKDLKYQCPFCDYTIDGSVT